MMQANEISVALPTADRIEDRCSVAGDRLPEIQLPPACLSCGTVLDTGLVREQLYVCSCGHHLRMHADAWIALLADGGTWSEQWADLRSRDYLGWREPKPYTAIIDQGLRRGLNESVRAGTCRLGGRTISLCVFDFRFLGGTLGVVGGERLARSLERARDYREPFILLTASGGARMQEGGLALMQMGKVNAAVTSFQSTSLPFFSVLSDPTFGGTAASLALLADVNIAEPGAAIGFTGARVIKQATHSELPPGFQSAEFQLSHGQVDMVVHRHELRQTLAHLLALHS